MFSVHYGRPSLDALQIYDFNLPGINETAYNTCLKILLTNRLILYHSFWPAA